MDHKKTTRLGNNVHLCSHSLSSTAFHYCCLLSDTNHIKWWLQSSAVWNCRRFDAHCAVYNDLASWLCWCGVCSSEFWSHTLSSQFGWMPCLAQFTVHQSTFCVLVPCARHFCIRLTTRHTIIRFQPKKTTCGSPNLIARIALSRGGPNLNELKLLHQQLPRERSLVFHCWMLEKWWSCPIQPFVKTTFQLIVRSSQLHACPEEKKCLCNRSCRTELGYFCALVGTVRFEQNFWIGFGTNSMKLYGIKLFGVFVFVSICPVLTWNFGVLGVWVSYNPVPPSLLRFFLTALNATTVCVSVCVRVCVCLLSVCVSVFFV